MRRKIGFLTASASGSFGRGGDREDFDAAVRARGGGSRRFAVGGFGGRGRLGLVMLVVFAGVMLAGRSAALANPACATASTATTCTFDATGAEQTFTLRPGVSAVTMTADGAVGGSVLSPYNYGPPGAAVTATVPLPPGTTTLYVEVGTPGTLGAGGFNGGGTSKYGYGGGGASDVRTCSMSACPDLNTQDTRLVVAGGGGGRGGDSLGCGHGAAPGGGAGDQSVSGPGDGGSGGNLCDSGVQGGFAGLGGTGAGAPGSNAAGSACAGQAGAPPTPAAYSCQGQGGGGGGGYFGGGGGGDGAEGGGGGAGSSFWISGATNASMNRAIGCNVYGYCAPLPPQVVITDGTHTSTRLASRPDPSVVGEAVTLTAKVTPIPDGGTVAFYKAGANGGHVRGIAGCGSQPVDTSTGKAKCHTTFRGDHQLLAKYSGDDAFVPSTGLGYQQVGAGP